VLHLFVWTLAVSPDRSLGGEQLSAMLVSRVGRIEVARTALAVLGCWALVLVRRDRLALLFAAAAMAVSSATGHSAAIHPAWTIPMRALHLVAIAVWLGGLLWLLSLDRSGVAVGVEAQRVSSAAMFAVIAVTFSGIVQTKFFIGEWADLVRSTYGYVALLKLAGLGVLVLFGAYHRYRVMPRLAEAGVVDDFARSLRKEVLVISVVILIGGLLAYIAAWLLMPVSLAPAVEPLSRRVVRSYADRKIAGVCAGLARYFDLDVTAVRLIWVVLSIYPGAIILGVIAYAIAWFIIPAEPHLPMQPATQPL